MNLKHTINHHFRLIIIACCWASCNAIYAQQSLLSNYDLLDSYVNPAMGGIHRNDAKLLIATRQQWASFQQPLTTHLAMVDYNFFRKQDFIACGLTLLKDQKANNGFATSSIQLNVGYHKIWGKHEFSMSFQPGYFSSAYQNNGAYPSQYDHSVGYYNQDLETNETIQPTAINTFNLNSGIFYVGKFSKVELGVGLAYFNANKHNTTSYINIVGVNQEQQFSTNSFVKIKLKEKLYLTFSGIYQQERKGNLNQLIAGSRLAYKAQRNTLQSIYVGSFVRSGIQRNVDAYIFLAGIRLVNLDIAFSYDYNVSALNQATGFYGATEIVLQYFIHRKLPERKLIPCERI